MGTRNHRGLFRARARQGCKEALAEKLVTSSIQVVQGQPGFPGYLVVGPANESQHDFISASTWTEVDAIRRVLERNGASHALPPGYAELIEERFVEYYHLTSVAIQGPSG